jgi:KDO2-lipid IV(A) lauroyltransferase
MRSSDVVRLTSLCAPELLADKSPSGKIIIMAHQGRPIMLSSALGLSGLKVGMLSQVIDERNPHLDATTRRFLNLKMDRTVRIAGGRWVTTADHLRVLYDAVKQGETIIIMMDLVEPDPGRQVPLPFHGGHLKLPPGIIRIAQRAGAKLYFGRALDQGSKTECSVVPLPADPLQAMLKAAQLLETDTQKAPWQWWQWNDLHLLWNKT